MQRESKEGKTDINLNSLGNAAKLDPGLVSALGRSVASKIDYARPVGGPENTQNKGENPNINNMVWPPAPSPWQRERDREREREQNRTKPQRSHYQNGKSQQQQNHWEQQNNPETRPHKMDRGLTFLCVNLFDADRELTLTSVKMTKT